MKKIAAIFILLYCLFINTAFAESLLLEYDGDIYTYTGDVYSLVVNGNTLTNLPLNPIIFNDRAVVPVREVFEAMGASVQYNANDNSVTINYRQRTVKLVIGAQTAVVDGVEIPVTDGVGAKLIAKWGEYPKTMVPVRFISESLGLIVNYDGTNKVISITESATQPETPPTAGFVPDVPADSTSKLTSLNYKVEGDIVTVEVTASSPVDRMSSVMLTSSGVVYVDVYGAKNGLASRTDVNHGVVKAVRVGQHEGYTRIAIDTEGIAKYLGSLTQSKQKITIMLSGNPNAFLQAPADVPNEPKPIQYNPRKIVVLDAGHGGSDPGASANLMNDLEKDAYNAALESPDPIIAEMGPGSGEKILEKDVALKVTHKVKENLEANGIEVIMTRWGDTYPTLDSRPELANSNGAVIFVSIHLNSTTTPVTAAKGIEVYYSPENNDSTLRVSSQDLADEILKCVIDSTDARSRGVKSGNLLVNRKSLMPSALIELGFMNNPLELELLIDETYQDKLAAGIARGIIQAHSKIVIP